VKFFTTAGWRSMKSTPLMKSGNAPTVPSPSPIAVDEGMTVPFVSIDEMEKFSRDSS
jgi:hypothetical protein